MYSKAKTMNGDPVNKSPDGFTLIEMAIVLGIIGFVLAMLIPVSVSMLDTQKRQDVRTRLSVIDSALVNFVVQNRRLPCPADGAIATGGANAGVEAVVCNLAAEVRGVVPWVTLGISEDNATDPWGGRITYRVDTVLAQATAMDMSACDPTGTAAAVLGRCSAACTTALTCTSPTNFLSGKGLPVSDGNGNWLNNPVLAPFTGAAYVLISHGPSTTGSYNSNGVISPGSIVSGTSEILNQNNQALMTGGVIGTSYRDAPLLDTPPIATQHFDDYLSYPTIMTVLQKANLGPRARY
jgi:prepilin-type N-terminal cleavage/methylation domain-containing protein